MSDRGGKLRRSTASISDPCKIRVRVVPVGQITRRDFYKYLSLISEYSILEVEQLLKSNNPQKSQLEKLLYRSGRIHINFVTESRESRAELEEFQYFRRTLGVLGVMDCEQCEDLEKCHEEFSADKGKFPSCISQRCFGFRANEGVNIDGVTMVPERADMGFYIQISMIEFISQLVLFCCDEAELVLAKESSNFASSWSLKTQKSSTPPARSHTRNVSSQIDFSARVYGLANSVGLGSDQKNKKLFQGRQLKIIADLYLMAGRFPEAAKIYMKAIDQTRTNIDNLFHVSSLEGYYCTMLLVSSINEDLAAFSYKGVPDELLVTISDSYLKDIVKIYETISHPLLQAECYLKVAKLLTVVWKLGTSKPAIDACIGDDFESSEDSENLKLLRNKHKLSRSYISSWAMRAWKPADKHLTASEKVGIFSAMAAIFEILGYNRKQAFFLRQSALLLLPKLTYNTYEPVLTASEDTVRVCLNRVCQGYWIDTQLGPPANPEFKELKYAAVYPKHQGWVALQKNVYKECIKLSEAISDFSSMGKYIFHMLLHLYPYLTKSEQEENGRTLLYLVQCHTLQFSHLDISTTLPNLVSFGGLKIDPSLDMYPLETTTCNSDQPAPLVFSFKKDDFEIMVKDEPFEIEILLSNPFRFPLELDEMQLLVEGVAVNQQNGVCTLPPKRCIAWHASLTPLASGSIQLVGLKMRILGCVQQEFKWPACLLTKVILHPQPFLKISRASLAQPSLMLFEGERSPFTLTLTNEGPVDANLVEVEFQGKLGKCVPELLTWKNHSPHLNIPSKGECTLTFEATGSGQGIVIINYAHLLDGERSSAYCRKKFYHVNLSISPTIHAIDFDVMNGSMAFIPSHVIQALKEAGMSPNDIQRQFCLLAMTLKNPMISSIQVVCNVELDKSAEGYHHSLTETVAPLESKRRLTVDREALEKGTQEQSIKRQLVKDLSITWQMQDGRQGDFLLDWVNITDTIRPIIQLEEVWLHTSLETNEGSGATLVNPFHYRCNLGTLVRLLVVLKNNRAMPITPCIRIQPYLDYHNGHFDAMLTSSESSLTPAVPLLVLGRNQEIFDEVSPHSSTQYIFEIFPSGIGQFRIGCSCQDLSDLLATKSQASHQTIDSTPLFLDVAPLVVDIVDPSSA